MTAGTDTPFFDRDENGVGRAAVRGTIVGGFVVAALAVAIGLYAGASLGDSLGMAAFAAFFGGPGLGGMLGAVMFISRQHAAVSATSPAPIADEADEGKSALVARDRDPAHVVVSKARRAPARARRSAPARRSDGKKVLHR